MEDRYMGLRAYGITYNEWLDKKIVCIYETTDSGIVSVAGSGLAGFFMGMFLRRLKFIVIIIGSFLGAVFWDGKAHGWQYRA
jgi:hypothetical protein